jgi:hypothetical protein
MKYGNVGSKNGCFTTANTLLFLAIAPSRDSSNAGIRVAQSMWGRGCHPSVWYGGLGYPTDGRGDYPSPVRRR